MSCVNEKVVSKQVIMKIPVKPDRSTPFKKMLLNADNDHSLILKMIFLMYISNI